MTLQTGCYVHLDMKKSLAPMLLSIKCSAKTVLGYFDAMSDLSLRCAHMPPCFVLPCIDNNCLSARTSKACANTIVPN